MTFLENIKAIPITDLAERMGFRLVRVGRYYSLKEHDSVRIDVARNCFWRNSRFHQGYKGSAGSSIDFYMEFAGETEYKKAMRQLALMYGIEGDKLPKVAYKKAPAVKPQTTSEKEHLQHGNVQLPWRNSHNNDVFRYLAGRRISASVIKYFFARKMLYEDKRHNCVFVSPLQDFACIRSTGERRFVYDCKGSNYDHCFFFKGREDASRLIVTESVIEAMSIMTYLQVCGERYSSFAYLALAGTNKIHAMFVHLKEQPQLKEVWLCLNRDEGGEKVDKVAIEGLKEMGVQYYMKKPPDPSCNDWNDYIRTLA